jgi:hypothetical protein
MTSWRNDKRFRCPDCGKPIRIAVASANRLADSLDVIAYCSRCNRFFDEKEWRFLASRPDPDASFLNDVDF